MNHAFSINHFLDLCHNTNDMINTFTVRANSEKNELSVEMDGCFMKSEMELALYLVKKETKKLISGFTLSINVKNLSTSNHRDHFDKRWIRNLAQSIGAGEINANGISTLLTSNPFTTVGFYPYENEWFLY